MANTDVPSMPNLGALSDQDIVYIIHNAQDYHTTWATIKASLNYRMNNLELVYVQPNQANELSLYATASYKAIEIDYYFDRNGRTRKGRLLIQNDITNAYIYETYATFIPLDDDGGVVFTVDITMGQVRLIITADNSDAEIGQFKYYYQLYA